MRILSVVLELFQTYRQINEIANSVGAPQGFEGYQELLFKHLHI